MATKSQSKKPAAAKKAGDAGKVGDIGKVKVTLIRSPIKTKSDHRATVRGLGLRRLNHTVELEDTPAVRGMINKVSYLLKCEG